MPDPAVMYDLRERLVRLETSQHHHYQWTQSIASQVASLDERTRKTGTRIGQTQDRVHGHTETLAELKSMPERLAALERAQKAKGDMIRYVIAAVVMGLALAGKGDFNEAIKILVKVAGIG